MIPYFEFEGLNLGPVTIHTWGVMVSLGLSAGLFYAYRLAKKYALAGEIILDGAIWSLLGAFIGARLFYVIFYQPAYFAAHPAEIIKIWQGGAASTGGFLGALAALYLFAKIRKLKLQDLRPYLDFMAMGLWLGWGIGRLGCFFTHLHPGKLSNFFLAVNYPGGARLDLGLLESITGFTLFATFAIMFQRLIKKQWGLVALYSTAAYAIIRFWLDFLRIGETHYWSLTPAQWGMLTALAGLGLIYINYFNKNGQIELTVK